MTIEEFKTEAEAVIDNNIDILWYLTEYENEIGIDKMVSIFSQAFEKTIKKYAEELKER